MWAEVCCQRDGGGDGQVYEWFEWWVNVVDVWCRIANANRSSSFSHRGNESGQRWKVCVARWNEVANTAMLSQDAALRPSTSCW